MPINKQIIEKLSKEHDCYYLYDENNIIDRITKLKAHFPYISFLYSIKCNPNSHVLHSIFSQGFGADAASLGEVFLAAQKGLGASQVFYSAPGKSLGDLKKAWSKATIIADSLGEIGLIEQIAQEKNCSVEIGARLNPEFSFSDGKCLPSKFGIDENPFIQFMRKSRPSRVRIIGLHVHLKSQELNSKVLSAYYSNVFKLAEKIETMTSIQLEFINLGSGIGIPYNIADTEVDLLTLSASLREIIATNKRKFRVIIEVGRYAVGKSGIYVTKVMDRKESCGKIYIILKNTLNGFARPSLARLVEHYASRSQLSGCEPLYTGRDSFTFTTLKNDISDIERVSLVGNLCTSTDVIAEDISIQHLERGDIVVINNAGAYAAVLSPIQFSSQEKPEEFFLKTDGSIER